MASSGTFEWAVVAAMSICTHLAERNYALRLLDPRGEPAFLRSPSAPEPDAEEFSGTSGLQSIAESLAAIQLSGPHHGGWELHSGREQRAAREHGGHDSSPDVFDDHLMDKLSAHRMRGPIIAVLGRISPAEARALGAGCRLRGKRLRHHRVRPARGFRRSPGNTAPGRLAGCCRAGLRLPYPWPGATLTRKERRRPQRQPTSAAERRWGGDAGTGTKRPA